MRSPNRPFTLGEIARIRSATHEIVTVHRSLNCPAVMSDRADACTCGAGIRYAIKRLSKARPR